MTWDYYWTEALDEAKERNPSFEEDEYYRSGRASKAHPDKEGPEWWAENGPKFVKSWQKWREFSGLQIWEYADENGELLPAIELECWAYHEMRGQHPDDHSQLIVRSFIDRVFIDDDGALYIVDLKTGTYSQPWPLQLALNWLGLKQQYADQIDPSQGVWGGFWKARKGGVDKWHDLSIYTDEWLWDQVWKAREIRDRQLFLANPNNLCTSACGVAKYCLAMGGTPPEVPFSHTMQP